MLEEGVSNVVGLLGPLEPCKIFQILSQKARTEMEETPCSGFVQAAYGFKNP